MKAIILAAGQSTRLAPLCAGGPKSLLPLHGTPMLLHQIANLRHLGINHVEVITGSGAELVEAACAGAAKCHKFEDYALGNNLLTMYHCRHLLDTDSLILFADALIDPSALRQLVVCSHALAVLVDGSTCRPDTMRVCFAADQLTDVGSHIAPTNGHGNFVGAARCSREGVEQLRGELGRLGADPSLRSSYYVEAMGSLAKRGVHVHVVRIDGHSWVDVDTPSEYEAAKTQDFYLVSGRLRAPLDEAHA